MTHALEELPWSDMAPQDATPACGWNTMHWWATRWGVSRRQAQDRMAALHREGRVAIERYRVAHGMHGTRRMVPHYKVKGEA